MQAPFDCQRQLKTTSTSYKQTNFLTFSPVSCFLLVMLQRGDYSGFILQKICCLLVRALMVSPNNYGLVDATVVNWYHIQVFWHYVCFLCFRVGLTMGEIGCFLSHFYIWQEVNFQSIYGQNTMYLSPYTTLLRRRKATWGCFNSMYWK